MQPLKLNIIAGTDLAWWAALLAGARAAGQLPPAQARMAAMAAPAR